MDKPKVPFKAYKVFNPDWTCRGKQYAIGETYREDVELRMCVKGMHACLNLADCFDYYSFDKDNKVAEVEILGDYITHDEDSKICTDHMRLVREIEWDEVIALVNTGRWNTGRWNSGNSNTGSCNTGNWNTGNSNTGSCNTGNWNTGHYNTGDRNTGRWNTGHYNTGDRNTGHWNTSDCNTGHCNTGNCNAGNWNTGSWNTGDWNTGDWNTGIFNTIEPTIKCFNRDTELKHADWIQHPAYTICNRMELTVFVCHDTMTEEEKKEHPEYETIGGYLKSLSFREACAIWWEKLSKEDRDTVMTIPNFDAAIFEEITGIKV